MARWHHWLDGRESEWTLGVGDGQGGLACCDSWGHKESDTTERLNWTEEVYELDHKRDPAKCSLLTYDPELGSQSTWVHLSMVPSSCWGCSSLASSLCILPQCFWLHWSDRMNLYVSWWLRGKAPACNAGDQGSIPGLGRFLWRRKWQPTLVFLPRQFHGQRSLAGCSPWVCKESDMTNLHG